MLDLARGQTPGQVRESYVEVYRELLDAGYTAVGEFHYLGLAEAHAAADAAREAGIELVLLYVAYARGGHRPVPAGVGRGVPARARGATRTRASGSASPPTPSAPARATGSSSSAATPPTTSCRSTCTPTSSRARSRSASPSTGCGRSSCSPTPAASGRGRPSSMRPTRTAASSTCSARRAPAICACPTTEANLGDGFLPVERILHRSIGLCIGSDSNVRIDPLEELRELDGIARRQAGRRDVFTVDALLAIGSARGGGRARTRDLAGDGGRPVASAAARRRGAVARVGRRLQRRRRLPFGLMDVTEATFAEAGRRALARAAGDRRLLGRVVRAVPHARAGARARGRERPAARSSS